MFLEPRSKTRPNIISIRTPGQAGSSVRKLRRWAGAQPEKVRKAIRSATLAAHQAGASMRRLRGG